MKNAWPIIKLELQKQKKTFLSVWAVIILSTLVVTFALPKNSDIDSIRVLRLMLLLLLTKGIPVLAAVFAAIPAAALRREPDVSIEQGYPTPPLVRVTCSLTAAAIYFFGTHALLTLLS